MLPASATARNVILAGANSSRYDNSDSRLLQCFTFQPSAACAANSRSHPNERNLSGHPPRQRL